MLQENNKHPEMRFRPEPRQIDAYMGLTAPSPSERFTDWLSAAIRRKSYIAFFTILLPVLAVALVALFPQTYEASTRVLVDPRGQSFVQNNITPQSGATDQLTSVVESEMRILNSDVVLSSVIRKLNLTGDPEFNGTKRYFWSPFKDAVDAFKTAALTMLGMQQRETPVALVALRKMQKIVRMKRVAKSFVLDLSVRTEDRDKSAVVANAIANEYLKIRFSTRAGITQRASETITGRLDELRRAVEVADEKVEKYKRDQGIINSSGNPVNEQQLTELNTELTRARAASAEAAVRVSQIRLLLKRGLAPDSVSEAVSSAAISSLRRQLARSRRQQASLSSTFLPAHPRLQELSKEIAVTKNLISGELRRVAETADLDLARAIDNERTLNKRLSILKEQTLTANEKRIRMRELEGEATAARNVYANLLVRAKELGEQQRVDSSHAVILSPAVPPRRAARPPLSLIAAAAASLGFGLGIMAALLKDARDPILRGSDQLAKIMGAHAQVRQVRFPRKRNSFGKIIQKRFLQGRSKNGPQDGAQLAKFHEENLSSAALENLRELTAEILSTPNTGRSKFILVTSTEALSGKSDVAICLGLLAAEAGQRALLVDGDYATRALSHRVGAADKPGLENLLSTGASDVVINIEDCDLDVIPNGQKLPDIGNGNIEDGFKKLAEQYSIVILDGGVFPSGRHMPTLLDLAHDVLVVTQLGMSRKPTLIDTKRIISTSGKERRLLPVMITA